MSEFKLPLYVKKAQRDLAPKRDASLAALVELLGGQWHLEVDFASAVAGIFNFFKEGESFSDSNREKFAVGLVELFYDHAPAAIVRNLTSIAADELAKEALQEALPKRMLRFSLHAEGGPTRSGPPGNPMAIEDGVLTWVVERGDVGNFAGQYEFFIANLGKNIEALL